MCFWVRQQASESLYRAGLPVVAIAKCLSHLTKSASGELAVVAATIAAAATQLVVASATRPVPAGETVAMTTVTNAAYQTSYFAKARPFNALLMTFVP